MLQMISTVLDTLAIVVMAMPAAAEFYKTGRRVERIRAEMELAMAEAENSLTALWMTEEAAAWNDGLNEIEGSFQWQD